MKYRVQRPTGRINAEVHLPASKSISNRVLIMHALSGGEAEFTNISESDDTRVMKAALNSSDPVRDIGHAGTSMRFLTAYFSCRKGNVRLTGSERMKERPIGPLVDALKKLGADINYVLREGFPPLDIKGNELNGGEINIDGGISSQFISALLMIAPSMRNGLTIRLEGEIVSLSYIHMTLALMRNFGIEATLEEKTIKVLPGAYRMKKTVVESDWSSASYWYIMGLLENHSLIRLKSLSDDSLQGDRALVDIFHQLGLVSDFKNNTVTLSKLANVNPGIFKYDFTSSPDLVQTMAVGLCLTSVPFKFTGTRTLRIKETDRIRALQEELKKLGYVLETDDAGSYVSWNRKTCEGDEFPEIDTYNDHRMAMAFAPAALVRDQITICDPEVVSKSYPGFWTDLRNAGFSIEKG